MHTIIQSSLVIGAGASLGALLRFSLTALAKNNFSGAGHYGTFAANIIGSFCLGLIMAYFAKHELSESWRQFLAIGLCGSLTTFSTLQFELMTFLQAGKMKEAALYFALSMSLGLLAVFAAWKIVV